MRIASYIFKKLIRCFTLLIGVSVLSFALLKASPVEPVLASVDYDLMLTIEQYNAIARHYGLDKPASASAASMGISWIISGFLGFVLGALGAFRRGEVIDRIIKWLAYLQISVPTFRIGLLFLLIFSAKLEVKIPGKYSGTMGWGMLLFLLLLSILHILESFLAVPY